MQSQPTVATHARSGVVLLLCAGVLWSTNGVFIKALHEQGLHGAAIASYRSLVAAIFLAPFAIARRKRIAHPGWTLAAVALFTAMCASFVIATTLTTAANAIILQYTAPAWVFLFSPWVNRERAEARQWLAFGAAMVAVALIFGLQYQNDPLGLSVGLLSGLVFGSQVVVFRKVSGLDPVLLIFLCCAGSGLLLLPVALRMNGQMLTSTQVYWVVGAGVVQFGIPYVLYAAGNRGVSAQSAVLIIMIEPVLNPVWVFLMQGEVPHWSTIVGGVLILMGVGYLSVTSTRPPRDLPPPA